MRRMGWVLLMSTALGLASLLACQRRQFEERTWIAPPDSQSPPPPWTEDSEFQSISSDIRIGSEVLHRKAQFLEGMRVEDAAQKEISRWQSLGERGASAQIIWAAQNRMTAPLSLRTRLNLAKYRLRPRDIRLKIEAQMRTEGFQVDRPPELMLVTEGRDFLPRLEVDLSDPKTGEFYRGRFDLNGNFKDRHRVGSAFQRESHLAHLYPLGPKRSRLSWVPLFLRPDGQGLSDFDIVLNSQSGSPMQESGQGPLSFAAEDPRFDQVHVLYFTERLLDYLRKNHQLSLPQELRIETHIGYPQKTNAAFYYRSVVRLGTGDDVSFRGLMRDPTVVTHEVAHAIIDALASLPYEGEGGSINEACADFLAASILGTPDMAEASYLKGPYRRRLENSKSWDERQGKLYADSEIISGLLWQLRKTWGAHKTEDFLLRLIARLLPNAHFEDFRSNMQAVAREMSAEDQVILGKIMEERKWL